MKHSQPTPKPPTANRSSGSGRWTMPTPQPGAFPNGNQSCPAECTAWWDLKFCIRSCCSRPGSWPECRPHEGLQLRIWIPWFPAERREIICVFWGSCAMALWASISHSMWASVNCPTCSCKGFRFRKNTWNNCETTHQRTVPRPSRMLPRHCKDCISIITFRSIQPTPKSPDVRTSDLKSSEGRWKKLGLELGDWMIRLLPFSVPFGTSMIRLYVLLVWLDNFLLFWHTFSCYLKMQTFHQSSDATKTER